MLTVYNDYLAREIAEQRQTVKQSNSKQDKADLKRLLADKKAHNKRTKKGKNVFTSR